MPGFGLWAARWWMPVLFIVIAGHLTNVCVTLFLHRAQTHRGVRLHYLAALPMRIWLWMSTSIVTQGRAAQHRLQGRVLLSQGRSRARHPREVWARHPERLDRASRPVAHELAW